MEKRISIEFSFADVIIAYVLAKHVWKKVKKQYKRYIKGLD